jgi:hypothetical protein
MKRFVLRCVLIIFAAGLVLAGLICYRTQRAAAAARQYLLDALQLQVGTSRAGDFARTRRKYRDYEYQYEGEPSCGSEDCVAGFWFPKGGPNRGINGIVHPSFLYSVLTLSHGRITGVSIGAYCYHKGGPPFSVRVLERVAGADFPVPFREDRNLSGPYVSWISFELTPAASADQRSRAYAFNLAYMNQFGTCKDATDLHVPDRQDAP